MAACRAIVLAALLLAGRESIVPSWAQGTSPATDATQTIEERVRQPGAIPALEATQEEAILTGRDDILLLRPRKLFELYAEPGYRFTTNAFLSDQFKHADNYFLGTVGGRGATRIDQQVDVFADAKLFLARYEKNPVLDYDAGQASLGAEMPLFDEWRGGFSLVGTWVYDRGFDRRLVRLGDFNIPVRKTFQIGNDVLIIPFGVFTRTWSSPRDFMNVQLRGGSTFIYAFNPKVYLSATPSIYWRHYDTFFESVFNKPRNDTNLDGQFGVVWTPTEFATVSTMVILTRNWSTIASNEYHALTAAPTLRLSVKF
ncbi:MAG: hypothetical protein U1F33_03595 [Alphaproteobacteria bacterium]